MKIIDTTHKHRLVGKKVHIECPKKYKALDMRYTYLGIVLNIDIFFIEIHDEQNKENIFIPLQNIIKIEEIK